MLELWGPSRENWRVSTQRTRIMIAICLDSSSCLLQLACTIFITKYIYNININIYYYFILVLLRYAYSDNRFPVDGAPAVRCSCTCACKHAIRNSLGSACRCWTQRTTTRGCKKHCPSSIPMSTLSFCGAQSMSPSATNKYSPSARTQQYYD